MEAARPTSVLRLGISPRVILATPGMLLILRANTIAATGKHFFYLFS